VSVSLGKFYAHKIKTAEEVYEIIGDLPRKKRAIMCHGVFDVVHPGHVRHMIYAKSKADILIASLTADKHIDKGQYRPHVPQDLRAVNLAAFEIVDYVIIDENENPIENIKKIKPDLFAKGYEYNENDVHPKTKEEMDVVESYGGEVIFTPGDIVYSSTSLINLAPPSIKHEKLMTVMERYGLNFDSLRETVRAIPGRKIHVVGDMIVDSLTNCTMAGGQTKTPTMSVLYEKKEDFVGGAGIVAKHIKAAGAEVVFSTVLGDDELKNYVLDDLLTAGVDVRARIDQTRPTTNKNAIVVGGYRLLKVDTLDNRSINDKTLEALKEAIQTVKADAVVFSDFRHGIFNRRTIPALIDSIPEGVFRAADSQVASRWGNITEFTGFDLITPNEREARFSLANQDSPLRPLASELYDAAQCKTLILKLGDRGSLTCVSPDHDNLNSFFAIDSFAGHVIDAVGSGDGLLAYGLLAQLVSDCPAQATIIGSMAAACVCERDGNVPVTPEDVLAKISTVEKQIHYDRG